MRIKNGFVLRRVADQYVVIATGEASKDFHGMIKLNQTGADIWNGITEGKTKEQIAEELSAIYGIEVETANKDVDALVQKMKESGFIVE